MSEIPDALRVSVESVGIGEVHAPFGHEQVAEDIRDACDLQDDGDHAMIVEAQRAAGLPVQATLTFAAPCGHALCLFSLTDEAWDIIRDRTGVGDA